MREQEKIKGERDPNILYKTQDKKKTKRKTTDSSEGGGGRGGVRCKEILKRYKREKKHIEKGHR